MVVAIVIGTWVELIKTFPVMLELDKRKIPWVFIHTGQHNLGDVSVLGIKKPDIVLTEPPQKGVTTKFFAKLKKATFWSTLMIPRIMLALRKIKNLRYVLYHGDTMSTCSAAIAASKLLNPFKKYKNAHLEAGLRSESLFEPFPEEISRHISDKLSDILFAVSDRGEQNLKNSILHFGKIYNVGNTIVDSTILALRIAEKNNIKTPIKKYALVTIHRDENIRYKWRLERIVDILLKIPIKTYFPLHDNTKKKLMDYGLYKKLKKAKNIKILKHKNYIEFIAWLKNCSLLVTDGGSIQEESLVFKKPCILLRKKTERQEGLETGLNFLTDLDINKTEEFIKLVLNPKYKIPSFKNPYGEFGVSKKVVDVLERCLK